VCAAIPNNEGPELSFASQQEEDELHMRYPEAMKAERGYEVLRVAEISEQG
jgi:hypothetical protein